MENGTKRMERREESKKKKKKKEEKGTFEDWDTREEEVFVPCCQRTGPEKPLLRRYVIYCHIRY